MRYHDVKKWHCTRKRPWFSIYRAEYALKYFRFKKKLKSRMEYACRFIQSIIRTIITQRRATNKSIMNLFFANVIFCPSIQNSVIYFLKDYDLFAYLGYTSLQFLFPSIPIWKQVNKVTVIQDDLTLIVGG